MKPDQERILEIKQALSEQEIAGGRPTFTVSIKGEFKHLTVFRISTDLPKFRIENGRTIRKQKERQNARPELVEVFKDRSSESAQQAQYEILLEMVSEENLIDLIKEEGQRDPLILTSEGYVLNGNRRLAAIRKLGEKEKNDRYRYVDVVMLQQLPETEIATIEMGLQMAREGKAKYNWLDSLLVVERCMEELDMPFETVVKALRTTSKALTTKQHMLSLVKEYLDNLGQSGEFFRLEKDEQAFKTLSEMLKQWKTVPAVRDRLKTEAFGLIANKLDGKSIHLQIRDLGKHIPAWTAEGENTDGSQTIVDETDPLSALESPGSNSDHVGIPSKEHSRETQRKLEEAVKEAEEERRRNLPLEQLRSAKQTLAGINMEIHQEKRAQVEAELKKIMALIQKMQSGLDSLDLKNSHK